MAKKAPTSDNLPEEIQKIKASFDKVYDSDVYKQRREKMLAHKNLYKSELWKPDMDASYSKAQINYIFSNIEQTAPLLTDNRPIWFLQSRSPRFQKLSLLYNKALEYIWDFRELDDLLFDTVKDDLLFGKGIVKAYWNDEEEEVDYDLIDPSTFCLAPGYTDLWKAAWCGEKSKKPMTWIRSVFPDTWQNVKPEGRDPEDNKSLGEAYSIELENWAAEVYQIWIRDDAMVEEMIKIEEVAYDAGGKEHTVTKKKKSGKKVKKYPNGRLLVFTATAELRDIPSPFDHGKPPYADMSNYKVNHEFWSMGDPEQIRELHHEINRQIQAMVRQGRVGENPNYTFNKEALGVDATQLKDLFFEGGNFWPAEPSPDGSDPINRVDGGGIDREHIDLIMLLQKGVEKISSVNPTAEGVPAKKERQSASEYAGQLESTYVRVRQKVRNLEKFVKRLNWLTVSLQQQYYDSPRYISFKEETEEGQAGGWAVISNQRDTALNYYRPQRQINEEGKPEEQGAYEARLEADEDYNSLVQDKDLDPIHFPFRVQIQSSSSLPKDRQSLANLFLRLAGVQITPNSPMTIPALLKALQIPDGQNIAAEKEKEKERIIKAKMAQGAAPPGRGPGPVLKQGA